MPLPLFLYFTADVRAITPSRFGFIAPSCEIISSVMPSAKNSWFGSPVRFWKGSTTMRICAAGRFGVAKRSEEHTSELQSQSNLVCRLLLEKKTERPGAQEDQQDQGHRDHPQDQRLQLESLGQIPRAAQRVPRRARLKRRHFGRHGIAARHDDPGDDEGDQRQEGQETPQEVRPEDGAERSEEHTS